MSSTIIYHMAPMMLPTALTGQEEDLFLIAAQMGSSNCFETSHTGRNGRRSRSWDALHFGTRDEILADAIRVSGSFEGGSLHLDRYRGYATPERYIGRVRRLLREAGQKVGPHVPFKDGYVRVFPERRESRTSRTAIAWDSAEEVKQFLSSVRQTSEAGPAYLYFGATGPELR